MPSCLQYCMWLYPACLHCSMARYICTSVYFWFFLIPAKVGIYGRLENTGLVVRIQKFEIFKKKTLDSKDSAVKFLKEAGIYGSDGKLSKAYK